GVLRAYIRPFELVERWLYKIHVTVLDQRAHESEQQREQQRPDVLSVHIGIRHEYELVVAQFRDVELVVDSGAERGDHRLYLGVLEYPVDPCLLHIDDLATKRQDRLVHGVAALLGGAARGISLHNVEFAVLRLRGTTVLQFPGQPADVERTLAPDQITRLPRSQPCLGTRDSLVDDRLGLARVALEPVGQPLVRLGLHERLRLTVTQLLLRLTLELWFRQFDRND